jgi:glycosyltransferase involved in cell wall biosynthesis
LPPYEIIVLDDASSDDSLAVLGELAGSIPLRIITNEKNSGSVFRQWQKGVAAARGEYVWIAEADDLSDPGFLRTVMAAFQLPDVVMSYCQSRQIDEHGKELSPDYLDYVADFGAERWREPFIADLSEELDHGLAVKNTIPNVSAVVFRRAELASVLAERSDEISEFRIAGDWLAYMHVLAAGTVAFNPAALNLHRRHAGGVTIGADHRPHLEEVLRVQRWIAERFELEDRTVDAAARYIEFLKVYFGLEPSRT